MRSDELESTKNGNGVNNMIFADERLSLKTLSVLGRTLTIVLGVAAAYFMTIQSLRLELAAKAENEVVTTLDKKLGSFEVILREGVVTKEQFYQFSRQVENRLIRIEGYLVKKTGETNGH